MGRLALATGESVVVPLGAGSAPHGIIMGPDDAAWITDGGLNAIVRVDSTTLAVQVYPLAVWEQMTSVANEGALNLRPDVRRFLLRVNLKGSHHQIDAKGRVLISQSLREKARLNGEVEVIGLNNHLEIWNKEVLESVIEKRPLSEEDFENIARLVPRGKTE